MLIKFLVPLLVTFSAWGYNLTEDFKNGFYWASLPVGITVIETDPTRKSQLETLSRMAVQEWETKTGLSLWDLGTGGTKNIIRWSKNFAKETKMDAGSVLAVAIRYTNGPYFAKTEIIINGQHGLNQDTQNLLTTITHELGHTIGLDHSENMMAVMAPTLQTPYYGLNFDDIQGMTEAYAQTENRQLTQYISPLAYREESSSNALSCATISPVASSSGNAFLSMGSGILIGFIRKIFKWFKSLR